MPGRTTARGYGNAHQRARRRVLARDPICTEPGCRRPSTIAHHEPPLAQRSDGFVADPSRSVCGRYTKRPGRCRACRRQQQPSRTPTLNEQLATPTTPSPTTRRQPMRHLRKNNTTRSRPHQQQPHRPPANQPPHPLQNLPQPQNTEGGVKTSQKPFHTPRPAFREKHSEREGKSG
jgi:hypothetical protein